MITRLSDNMFTCQNESLQFECIVNSSRVQWVAEPFINATGSPVAFNSESSSRRFEILQDDSTIISVVQLNSLVPFRTSMMVSGKLLGTVNVTCIDLIRNRESQSVEYRSGGKNFIVCVYNHSAMLLWPMGLIIH